MAMDIQNSRVYIVLPDGYFASEDVFHSYPFKDKLNIEKLAVDQIVTESEFKDIVENSGHRTAYCLRRPFKSRKRSSFPSKHMENLFSTVDDQILYSNLCQLRTFKSETEMQAMQSASDIGSSGINLAMAVSMPGLTENDVASFYELYCRVNHADFKLPYQPIVAAGMNAATLHYRPKDVIIKDSEMVLLDMGCSIGYYASDISRTFPASGKFTAEQRVI